MKRRRKNRGPAGVPRRGPWRTPEEHRAATSAVHPRPATPAAPLVFGNALDRAAFGALLRELGLASYAEYLWSPLWLAIRRRVLKRAYGRCEDCGRRACQVHHLAYTRENVLGDSLESLLAVCDGCHARRHGVR